MIDLISYPAAEPGTTSSPLPAVPPGGAGAAQRIELAEAGLAAPATSDHQPGLKREEGLVVEILCRPTPPSASVRPAEPRCQPLRATEGATTGYSPNPGSDRGRHHS